MSRSKASSTGPHEQIGTFDVALPLLLFNHIPHAFVSIFKQIYKLLSSDGVMVLDEIRGFDVGEKQDWQDQALRCLDAEPELLLSSSPVALDNDSSEVKQAKLLAAFYRDEHIKRIHIDRAFWAGAAVKGTNLEILREAATKLFIRAFKPIIVKVLEPRRPRDHLPFWWFAPPDSKPTLTPLA